VSAGGPRRPASEDVPVLLVTFRRPETTAAVVDALRAMRPRRLFLAGDGPRGDVVGEADAVAATRRILATRIDWDCSIERRFSDVHLGCRQGVTDAVTWFLDAVPEGLILEDDCVPHPDLLPFCADLLDRYRDDPRVMAISGENSVGLRFSGAVSYGFMRHAPVWGWATWRRAWVHHDDALDGWPALRSDPVRLAALWPDRAEREWHVDLLDGLRAGRGPDSWAHRWAFSVAACDGLVAVPRHNLVRNVGFGPGATHTRSRRARRADVPSASVLPLRHPGAVVRDVTADHRYFVRALGGAAARNPARRAVRRVVARAPALHGPARWFAERFDTR